MYDHPAFLDRPCGSDLLIEVELLVTASFRMLTPKSTNCEHPNKHTAKRLGQVRFLRVLTWGKDMVLDVARHRVEPLDSTTTTCRSDMIATAIQHVSTNGYIPSGKSKSSCVGPQVSSDSTGYFVPTIWKGYPRGNAHNK